MGWRAETERGKEDLTNVCSLMHREQSRDLKEAGLTAPLGCRMWWAGSPQSRSGFWLGGGVCCGGASFWGMRIQCLMWDFQGESPGPAGIHRGEVLSANMG